MDGFPFPEMMDRKLLRMTSQKWRALRARIRHGIARYSDYSAPVELRAYIDTLPDDYQVWENYAQEITRRRRYSTVTKKRELVRKRTKDQRAKRREYQRDYMQDYRQGYRRRASKDGI